MLQTATAHRMGDVVQFLNSPNPMKPVAVAQTGGWPLLQAKTLRDVIFTARQIEDSGGLRWLMKGTTSEMLDNVCSYRLF